MRRTPGIRSAVCSTFVAVMSLFGHRTSAQKTDDRQGVFSFLVAAGLHQGEAGRDTLTELVDRAAALKVKPAFVVAVGDVTQSGAGAEYELLHTGIKRATDVGILLYAVPGYRDVSALAEGKERFTRAFGKTYQSFDLNSAHFILLDSTVSLHGLGHLDKIELEWLDRDLKRTRLDAPIFVFLYHSAGQQSPSDRPLDNDYDLLSRLKGRNVVALFSGDQSKDAVWNTNGITMLSEHNVREGSLYQVSVSPLIASIDRLELNGSLPPVHVSTLPTAAKTKGSLLRVIWDDPDIPYLERRRPAATLAPRVVADNPDKERAEYRIDSGPWKPLIKDRRDIWSDVFLTKDIAVGIHTADVRLTTSNDQRDQDELIFEVERDSREATRKWAVDLPSSIQSNSLLAGDTLYVSCQDDKLYALNTLNGKKRWIFPAKAGFLASPVLSNGVVYIGSTDKTFYAVETASGHMKWRVDTEGPILATAACARGIVCCAAADKVFGMDLETGLQKWSQPVQGPLAAAVVSDGDAFYVSGWDGACYSFDAVSGNVRWRVKVGAAVGQAPGAAPCVLNGRVYCSAGDGALHCLDAANGTELWAKFSPTGEDPILNSSPAICGSSIIACGSGNLGSVYAFDGASGTLLWHLAIGQPIESCSVHPAPNGRSIAVMGVRGKTMVLASSTGSQLWGYELGPGNVFSTPEYDGSLLYTTTMANDVQAINGPGVGK